MHWARQHRFHMCLVDPLRPSLAPRLPGDCVNPARPAPLPAAAGETSTTVEPRALLWSLVCTTSGPTSSLPIDGDGDADKADRASAAAPVATWPRSRRRRSWGRCRASCCSAGVDSAEPRRSGGDPGLQRRDEVVAPRGSRGTARVSAARPPMNSCGVRTPLPARPPTSSRCVRPPRPSWRVW